MGAFEALEATMSRASNQLAPTAVFFDTIPWRQIFVTAKIQQGGASWDMDVWSKRKCRQQQKELQRNERNAYIRGKLDTVHQCSSIYKMATALWSLACLACLACLATNIKTSDIAWKAWLWLSWITAPFHHWLGEPSSLDPACQCVRMLASCILHFSFQRAIQLWKWPCTGHEDRASAEVSSRLAFAMLVG